MVLRPGERLAVQLAGLQAGVDVAVEGEGGLQPLVRCGSKAWNRSRFSFARLSEIDISRLQVATP